MRKFSLFIIALSFFIGGAQATATPCQKLSQKVCHLLGKAALHCRIYEQAAAHPKVSQKLCRRYLQNWSQVKGILVRKEGYLRQMDQLAAQNGPQAKQQVAAYKRRFRQKTLLSLIEGNQRQVLDRNICQKLPKKVCTDLGHRSYYCQFFRQLLQKYSQKLNPRRCKLIVNNWAMMQKNYYIIQELRLRKMAKKAKYSAKNKKAFLQAQSLEWQRLFKFMTGR